LCLNNEKVCSNEYSFYSECPNDSLCFNANNRDGILDRAERSFPCVTVLEISGRGGYVEGRQEQNLARHPPADYPYQDSIEHTRQLGDVHHTTAAAETG